MVEINVEKKRFNFWDDGMRAKPATDGREFRNGEEGKYPLGRKGKSLGLPKISGSQGKTSEYKEVKGGSEEEEKALAELKGLGIRRYYFKELHAATQGFSDACQIWDGGSCVVYKGVFGRQQAVAIRVLPRTDRREAISLHMTEAKVLSQVRHRNVVQLLGYCQKAEHLALVFEFVSNHSLADHLQRLSLPWKVRYSRIAVGLASALFYLHEGLERCVVHRDIKPANILLDSDFNPKLAGFGLAIISEHGGPEPEFSDILAATLGYLEPQVLLAGKNTKASDIFGFGVVALQIASGREASDPELGKPLPKWVEELHEKGRILEAVDPKLGDDFDEREAERLLLVGLWCTQLDAEPRPSMKLILQLLNFEAPSPTNFISNVFKTLIGLGIHSPLDTDATTTSTKSRTGRYAFKDIDANEISLVLVQDNQANERAPALPPEDAVFNIGIPLDFTSSDFKNHRKDHDCHILKGIIGKLYEMMRSKGNLPRFDGALGKIKMYTEFLVQEIGPPLDDWNTLAQLVLRTLKDRENFFEFYTNRTSPIDNITMLSFNEDMRKCVSTINKDRGKLNDCKKLLAQALEKCSSLESELAKTQEISFSIAEQIEVVEQRITENLSSLEREGHYAISQQYEHLLSKLSTFTC